MVDIGVRGEWNRLSYRRQPSPRLSPRYRTGAGPVLALNANSAGMRTEAGRSPSSSLRISSMATEPNRSLGWRTVVSGTRKNSLTKTLPNPATLRS